MCPGQAVLGKGKLTLPVAFQAGQLSSGEDQGEWGGLRPHLELEPEPLQKRMGSKRRNKTPVFLQATQNLVILFPARLTPPQGLTFLPSLLQPLSKLHFFSQPCNIPLRGKSLSKYYP